MMVNNKKQGIVSILGSDYEITKTPSSLRRTLSADMSSRQWQVQHGFTTLKKIASSKELSHSIIDSTFSSTSSSSSGEEEEQLDAFHSSTQEEKKQLDIWSLIISQKEKEDPKDLPPAYIHPLVKRSASSLSKKSLEICTESLGSETGSDGYSSYPPSEAEEDQEADKVEQEQEEKEEEEEEEQEQEKLVQEYNFPMTKYRKSQQPIRCFPPPVTSLISNRDGVSLQMRSRRDNGRLVLEAVSILSQKNFSCQRQDGRLVLSLMNNPPTEEEEEEDSDEQFEVEIENGEAKREEAEEEVIEEEEEEEEPEIYKAEVLPSGVISVHRLAVMMNKKVWANKYNEVVKLGGKEEEEEEEMVVERISINPVLTQSLPPRPPVSRSTKAAASFNAYEYFWRPKSIIPSKVSGSGPITQNQTLFINDIQPNNNNNNKNKHILSKNYMINERQEVLLLRGNRGDYLVKGCKEPRRSLMVWEPHCIATT